MQEKSQSTFVWRLKASMQLLSYNVGIDSVRHLVLLGWQTVGKICGALMYVFGLSPPPLQNEEVGFISCLHELWRLCCCRMLKTKQKTKQKKKRKEKKWNWLEPLLQMHRS